LQTATKLSTLKLTILSPQHNELDKYTQAEHMEKVLPVAISELIYFAVCLS